MEPHEPTANDKCFDQLNKRLRTCGVSPTRRGDTESIFGMGDTRMLASIDSLDSMMLDVFNRPSYIFYIILVGKTPNVCFITVDPVDILTIEGSEGLDLIVEANFRTIASDEQHSKSYSVFKFRCGNAGPKNFPYVGNDCRINPSDIGNVMYNHLKTFNHIITKYQHNLIGSYCVDLECYNGDVARSIMDGIKKMGADKEFCKSLSLYLGGFRSVAAYIQEQNYIDILKLEFTDNWRSHLDDCSKLSQISKKQTKNSTCFIHLMGVSYYGDNLADLIPSSSIVNELPNPVAALGYLEGLGSRKPIYKNVPVLNNITTIGSIVNSDERGYFAIGMVKRYMADIDLSVSDAITITREDEHGAHKYASHNVTVKSGAVKYVFSPEKTSVGFSVYGCDDINTSVFLDPSKHFRKLCFFEFNERTQSMKAIVAMKVNDILDMAKRTAEHTTYNVQVIDPIICSPNLMAASDSLLHRNVVAEHMGYEN